eukprot:g4078.t1
MSTASGLTEAGIEQLLENCTRFQLIRKLGSGAFGTVAEVFDVPKKRNVALKFVAGGARMRNVEREVLNHRALHHPHVVEYKKVFPLGGYLVIVMEHANGGDLYDFVVQRGKLCESDARTLYQQLIIAVDYCHKRHVSSRDIKCENLLLHFMDRSTRCPLLKLCDFGYSCRRLVQTDPTSIVGSLDYMPPEVILNVEKKNYSGEKYDIWSCGVVLYVMLIGVYPFSPVTVAPHQEEYQAKLRASIRALDYRLPSFVSREAADLIRRSLCYANERISMKEILQHPWFLHKLPLNALKMNDELLSKNTENMKLVESRQSEKTVKTIIQSVRLGRDPSSSSHFTDADIDKIFTEELIRAG